MHQTAKDCNKHFQESRGRGSDGYAHNCQQDCDFPGLKILHEGKVCFDLQCSKTVNDGTQTDNFYASFYNHVNGIPIQNIGQLGTLRGQISVS